MSLKYMHKALRFGIAKTQHYKVMCDVEQTDCVHLEFPTMKCSPMCCNKWCVFL